MPDREKVIKGLEYCIGRNGCWSDDNHEECPWIDKCREDLSSLKRDALALLKEQQNLLEHYEKLSQVCFKIEKYLKIADLSILIDRIEEGKVEVLQDDGRPDSMETTIKIRRK